MTVLLRGVRIEAFGSIVEVETAEGSAGELLPRAGTVITDLHDRLTRFESDSELSRLNRDPRETVPASPVMIDFVAEAARASEVTGGLVDATVLPAVEAAGYTSSRTAGKADGPGRQTDATDTSVVPHRPEAWRSLAVDRERGLVSRPVGTRLDAGGIGKGLAADLVARIFEEAGAEAWSVNCLGDLRFGGSVREPRTIMIDSPFEGHDPVGSIDLPEGGIATSGTTRRAWRNGNGASAHHLIDPRTGKPAETGLIQVTAVAPTAVEAEARAKAALLSGPEGCGEWLSGGGIAVDEQGEIHRFGPPEVIS